MLREQSWVVVMKLGRLDCTELRPLAQPRAWTLREGPHPRLCLDSHGHWLPWSVAAGLWECHLPPSTSILKKNICTGLHGSLQRSVCGMHTFSGDQETGKKTACANAMPIDVPTLCPSKVSFRPTPFLLGPPLSFRPTPFLLGTPLFF